ncbi:MAG: hypothetical protein GXX91_13250 [Verrucomicrobiaceae bacterium]|nr:hypothetical protein [Verrucomicrobiaceae bacterium]
MIQRSWSWRHRMGVLITRDVKTIPSHAFERVSVGQVMSGVLALPSTVSMATAIQELAFIAVASEAEDWIDRVTYLPLR